MVIDAAIICGTLTHHRTLQEFFFSEVPTTDQLWVRYGFQKHVNCFVLHLVVKSDRESKST